MILLAVMEKREIGSSNAWINIKSGTKDNVTSILREDCKGISPTEQFDHLFFLGGLFST